MKASKIACCLPGIGFMILIANAFPPLAGAQGVVPATVPGWSDPYLAGMPEGSTASCNFSELCDEAPAQSPQLVEGLCLLPGESLTFEASGGVAQDPDYPLE
ncbi:MAG: hypothetical protein QUU85_00335, partial [Candidatus Eisenbacteria bacterium]|nr:hypothetical protein [Candidatus Eisenbacteria bacterium]